jgi:hypothetical protein
VDGQDASGGREAHRDGEARGRLAAFALGVSQSSEVGDDAVASAWPRDDAVRGPLVSVRAAARGRWRPRGW